MSTAEPGPGKYDALCTYAREQADARAVLLVVLGGKLGSGFSVQAEWGISDAQVVAMLRHTADVIEQAAAKSSMRQSH